MSNQLKLNQYKQLVANYFNARTNYDDSELAHHRAERLLKSVQLKKGQKILDIATGTGLIAISAAQMVGDQGKVIGVDIASGLLQKAQLKISKLGLQNIDLIEADADILNFSENHFDIILCCSAIMIFQDIIAVLKNWYTFLKNGGIVAFNAYAQTSLMTPIIVDVCAKHDITLPNIHEPLGTPAKCHSILDDIGFQTIEIKTEQLGRYISVNNAKQIFDGNTWLHIHNPLSEITLEQKEVLKADFAKVIESSTTNKGVWQDITTFFVTARK